MSRHVKKMALVCVALLSAVAYVTSATAGQKNNRVALHPGGEPVGIKRLDTECYKVWFNDEGWHLQAIAGDKKEHRYSGSVEVDGGVLLNVRSPLMKEGKLDPEFRRGPKEDRMDFDFKSYQPHRGFSFNTPRGTRTIRFKLQIDGKDAPDQIFVGKNGDHPAESTFVLPARP